MLVSSRHNIISSSLSPSVLTSFGHTSVCLFGSWELEETSHQSRGDQPCPNTCVSPRLITTSNVATLNEIRYPLESVPSSPSHQPLNPSRPKKHWLLPSPLYRPLYRAVRCPGTFVFRKISRGHPRGSMVSYSCSGKS